MKKIQDKPGGRPAKKRTEKQKKVVSTKLRVAVLRHQEASRGSRGAHQ